MSGEPYAPDHQRLPASPRRHPAVRAQPGDAAAARLARRLRLALAGLGEVRRRPAVSGDPRGHLGAAADALGGPAGGRDRPGSTAATACGSARPPRSGCSPPGCGNGPISGGWWRSPTGTRSAGRRCPAPAAMLRRIARGVDVVTYLGEYTRSRLARAVGDLTTLERLPPGVDTDAFAPSVVGGRGSGRARPRRPTGRRLRVPARAAQGAGHPDPGAARDPPPGPGRRPAAGGRRTVPVHIGGSGPGGGRRDGTSSSPVRCPWARAAGTLRGGRRLRDAVPDPPRRARRRRSRASSTSRRRRPACRWSAGDSGGAPDAVLRGGDGIRGRVAATAQRWWSDWSRC